MAGECVERLAGIEHWLLQLNAEQAVPALLLRPRQAAPRGVVLYCHAHGNRFEMGKDEALLGRPALQSPAPQPPVAGNTAGIDGKQDQEARRCIGARPHRQGKP